MDYSILINDLKAGSNFRHIPGDTARSGLRMMDLSTNDYMGFAADSNLAAEFFSDPSRALIPMSSSAARLLASHQQEYLALESLLSSLYGREALLFNSGYHANTGLIPALADRDTVILADRLVHASIIDGIRLSGVPFERWRHNDVNHLERLVRKYAGGASAGRLLVIAESIYSMDGDMAPLADLVALRRRYPQILLYVDEAHAVGACGPRGLGLVSSLPDPEEVDLVIGTFGKALASQGAFAIMSPLLKDVAVNRARSFIFSTALPPMAAAWTSFVIRHSIMQDHLRAHLAAMASRMGSRLGLTGAPTHIMPCIIGDSARALAISARLLEHGVKILPIRTPTVPPGTERLRISLNAALTAADIDRAAEAITEVCRQFSVTCG